MESKLLDCNRRQWMKFSYGKPSIYLLFQKFLKLLIDHVKKFAVLVNFRMRSSTALKNMIGLKIVLKKVIKHFDFVWSEHFNGTDLIEIVRIIVPKMKGPTRYVWQFVSLLVKKWIFFKRKWILLLLEVI